MAINSDLTNFGRPMTNSDQTFTFQAVITFEPIVLEKNETQSTWLLSSCWSHSMAYFKTPPIISHFEKYSLFTSSKLVQFFLKLADMIFGPSHIEITEQNCLS